MCKRHRQYGLVCLLTSDFNPALIPPQRVERSREVCNHTPQPEGYLQWHEWARQASKTHSQVRCLRCGDWKIWLPKAEARETNRREDKEAKAFAKAYLQHTEKERKARERKVKA